MKLNKNNLFKPSKLKLILFKLFGKRLYGKDCINGICCEVVGYAYKGNCYIIEEDWYKEVK